MLKEPDHYWTNLSLNKLLLFEIFERDNQHSKTFPILFSQMFVVHFMCPSHSPGIPIIGISEHFEPLVYKNIVDHEIGYAVGQDPETQRPPVPKGGGTSKIEQCHAHGCIE